LSTPLHASSNFTVSVQLANKRGLKPKSYNKIKSCYHGDRIVSALSTAPIYMPQEELKIQLVFLLLTSGVMLSGLLSFRINSGSLKLVDSCQDPLGP
jgi:hypothetical protein